MAGRSTDREANRLKHYLGRVSAARTPKAALWAYCHWLVAVAGAAGPQHVEQATEMVRDRIEALTEARKEGSTR